MPKHFLLFLISISTLSAQPFYTPLRASFGVEAFGTAPQGQAFAEVMFGYKPKSFWDLQAGLGLFNIRDYTTYSISTALTYNILLNPFRRKECWPHPGYNSFEAYLEGGAAIFVLDKYVNSYFAFNDQQKVITPLGLAGLRFHFISERWIYILKVRYTPSLIESKLASVAGVALGIGWR